MLVNRSSKPVYVFRTLDWGVSASLSLHLHDASGKEIKPEFPADAQTDDSPDDKSAFVKLGPDHFLGANFPASIRFLNFSRPGKYSIYVEYASPFSNSEVGLKPFFGKENGTLKSNVGMDRSGSMIQRKFTAKERDKLNPKQSIPTAHATQLRSPRLTMSGNQLRRQCDQPS